MHPQRSVLGLPSPGIGILPPPWDSEKKRRGRADFHSLFMQPECCQLAAIGGWTLITKWMCERSWEWVGEGVWKAITEHQIGSENKQNYFYFLWKLLGLFFKQAWSELGGRSSQSSLLSYKVGLCWLRIPKDMIWAERGSIHVFPIWVQNWGRFITKGSWNLIMKRYSKIS